MKLRRFLNNLKLNNDIWFFPKRDYPIKENIDRRERIRINMMKSFLYWGKRAKYVWMNRWYGTGDGTSKGAIRWIGTAILGLQTIVTKDFTWLIIFYMIYIPIITIFGFLYYWYDVQGMDAATSLLIDPLAYQMRKKLDIDETKGM